MAAFAVSDPRLAGGIAARKGLLLTRNVDRVVFARILGNLVQNRIFSHKNAILLSSKNEKSTGIYVHPEYALSVPNADL